jgi:hypothetical protein
LIRGIAELLFPSFNFPIFETTKHKSKRKHMKKIYALSLFALTAFAFTASAQCTVSITSLTASGLTATGTSSGSGAAAPVYLWSWGDSQTSSTQNASHTYSTGGTYTVCIGYVDAANTSCVDTACQMITVSAVGIATTEPVKAEVTTMPNPFVVSTNVAITLNKSADVQVTVFDVTGKQVEVLQNGTLDAGLHVITWKPEHLAEGVYFLQVNAGGMIQTRKIVHTSGN